MHTRPDVEVQKTGRKSTQKCKQTGALAMDGLAAGCGGWLKQRSESDKEG